MNKKLVLVILAGLVFLVGFSLVYARHISKETRPTKPHSRTGVQPVETTPVLKQRIRTGTIQEKPKTLDDLKTALERVGKTYTPPVEPTETEPVDVGVTKIATPAGILDERSLTECLIWPLFGHVTPVIGYFDQYMNCCGRLEIWIHQDAQLYPGASQCGYPIYPFEVSAVEFCIYTPDSCTLECEFAVTWDYGSIYWGYPFPYYEVPDWSSGQVNIEIQRGANWLHVDVPAEERPCYHVPFFAMFSLLNSDDFTEGPDPVRCGPDTTRYDFWIQSIKIDAFQSEQRGYYYNDLIGGYYDLKDIWGRIHAVCASGFTRDQNECELESLWHHKAAYFDTTEEGEINAYAPDGIPDFNQYDTAFANGGVAYCGPTALANCLWWCFSGGFLWYSIHNWYEAWDPSVPLQMIQELAVCMNTDPAYGTDVYDLQQCINDLNDTPVFSLTESTIFQPTFDEIEYQLRLSQDVILLIGFWYFDEEAEQWYRYGGHYVTVSGVNWEFFLLSFSDPALNGVCDYGWYGDSSGFGYYIPHTEPFCDPFCHYDAGNVSHDYYQVLLESPSPGGILALPQYGNEPESIWMNFFGQNFTPELEAFRSVYWEYYPTWTYRDLFDGTVILGSNAYDLAFSLTAVEEEIRFFPYHDLEYNYSYYEHMLIDTCYAKYFHNVPDNELPLDVEMFAIGLDPGGDFCQGKPCGDLILQKFVITNTGETTIDSLEWALFMDWNVNQPDPNTSFGGGDSSLNTSWAYDSLEEGKVAFTTLVPTRQGKIVTTFHIGDPNVYFYPFVPGGPYDDLKTIMETSYWSIPDKVPVNTGLSDYAYLMSSEEFSLDPDSSILQEYIIWYDNHIPETDYAAFKHKLYQLLRLAGYYRGDVGDFSSGQGSPGMADITDIVYIVNYLFKDGPSPHPFIDQGDVNCDGECDIADVVQLANYLLKGTGAPPADKNRFFPSEYQERFTRTSLFADPQWQNLGQ